MTFLALSNRTSEAADDVRQKRPHARGRANLAASALIYASSACVGGVGSGVSWVLVMMRSAARLCAVNGEKQPVLSSDLRRAAFWCDVLPNLLPGF